MKRAHLTFVFVLSAVAPFARSQSFPVEKLELSEAFAVCYSTALACSASVGNTAENRFRCSSELMSCARRSPSMLQTSGQQVETLPSREPEPSEDFLIYPYCVNEGHNDNGFTGVAHPFVELEWWASTFRWEGGIAVQILDSTHQLTESRSFSSFGSYRWMTNLNSHPQTHELVALDDVLIWKNTGDPSWTQFFVCVGSVRHNDPNLSAILKDAEVFRASKARFDLK